MHSPLSNPKAIGITGLTLFVLLLTPLIWFRYFPTVDGPSHLYNAAIIRDMWFSGEPFFTKFFLLNPEPVPNWSGHLVMILSGLVFPPWLVEKTILLLIVFGIPFAVFALVRRSFNAVPAWHWLLLLPLTYNLVLYLGFFNFLLSIVMLFLVLPRMWNFDKYQGILGGILLVTATWLTHLLGFLLLAIFTAAGWAWQMATGKITKAHMPSVIRKIICFVPGLLLSLIFFNARGVEGFRQKVEKLPFSEIWMMIRDGAPLAGLNGAVEVPYTSTFVLLIGILILFVIAYRFKRKSGFVPHDLLLVCAAIMLAAVCIIPDGIVAGGFITIRFLLLMHLFIVAWLMCQRLPMVVSLVAAFISLYTAFGTFQYRYETARLLSSDVSDMVSLANHIRESSIILPLNYSENWLHINISSYLGATKPVLVLDNYEAVLGEFPLRWRKQYQPESNAGNFTQSLNPSIDPAGYLEKSGVAISNITRWNYFDVADDSTRIHTGSIINREYYFVAKKGRGEVFEIKTRIGNR